MFYIRMFHSGPEPFYLYEICDLVKRTSSPSWGSLNSYNLNSISRGAYYCTKPSKGTVWIWYGLEVNQFLLYNRPLNILNQRVTEYFTILIWKNYQ